MINRNTWKCSHGEHPLCKVSSSQGVHPSHDTYALCFQHRSPFGLLRSGRPWLQGKRQKRDQGMHRNNNRGQQTWIPQQFGRTAEWPGALSASARSSTVCSEQKPPHSSLWTTDTRCCRSATPQSKHSSMWADKRRRKLLLANEFIRVLLRIIIMLIWILPFAGILGYVTLEWALEKHYL